MAYIILAAIIILDQATKFIYVGAGAPTITLIPGLLGLTYVENRGAAWGLFNNNQPLLYIFSALVTLAMLAFFIRKYKKLNKLLRIALALIMAGALGNMIDRFAFMYVRDMIQFLFIDFPIFNVADSAITIGGVLLFIDVIFFEQEKKNDYTGKETVSVEAEKENEAQSENE